MGQRGNYIIKENDTLTIHYTHWRANCIAADLYLGEKRFLEFVNRCQCHDEILNEPWIEGLVIIDKTRKELFFWAFEFTKNTSVIQYYLEQLAKKWDGWKLTLLKNHMYDAEKILGIDYISRQEFTPLHKPSTEDVLTDNADEWVSTLVIVKQANFLVVTKTGNLSPEGIIGYGQAILPLIKNKPRYDLPKEGDEGTHACLFIDEDLKKIVTNESSFGLVDMHRERWPGYDLQMSDMGYIELLQQAGIETAGLELTEEEIKSEFLELVRVHDDFDPFATAERMKQEFTDVQFNPNFFDNVKPQKSFMNRLKESIQKITGQKK